MSLTRDHHRQLVLLTVFDGIIIPNGSTGLDEGRDTRLMSELYAVVEWEKSITGHHGTVQVELKLLCLFNSLTK
jgi:hypothetical protein